MAQHVSGERFRTRARVGRRLGLVVAVMGAATGFAGCDVGSSDSEDVEIITRVSGRLVDNGTCQDESCCPNGQTTLAGTAESDHLVVHESDTCVVSQAGADHVVHNGKESATVLGGDGDDFIRGPKGPGSLSGGDGNDSINAMGAGDECLGGPGDDDIHGGGGSDELFGNAGHDSIKAGAGDDLVVPGPGRDDARGEAGNDTIKVHDICELESGEVLDGGQGNDTLSIPMPLEEVEALGVFVTGFENVVVEPNPCSSECSIKNLCEGSLVEGSVADEVFCCGDDAESIMPAAGVDRVEAGAGDDTVVIQDPCQLGAGEILDGQGGDDTLITPVSVAELQALGVTVTGFETVEVGTLAISCDASCECDQPEDVCPPEGLADPELVAMRAACLGAIGAFRTFFQQNESFEGQLLGALVASAPEVGAAMTEITGNSDPESGPLQEPVQGATNIDTSLMTCDRPPLPSLPPLNDCDQEQRDEINFAFNHADFFNWRSQQIMDAVLAAEHDDALAIWIAGNEIDPEDIGADNAGDNAGFRAWFGLHSDDHADVVAQTLELNRNTLDGINKNIACWDDPCPTFFQCLGNWLARPLTTARRLSSPCAWTSSLAHAFYRIYDPLTLPFPSLEVCDGFFGESAATQGGVLLHEWLHFESNDAGSLRDNFVGDGCSGSSCQIDDAVRFARDQEPFAFRHIRNFQFFQESYGRAYLENRCEELDLFCFEPQTETGTCGDGDSFPFPDPLENCQDDGICPGRPCFEVEPGADGADQTSAAHPDGDAVSHYCDSNQLNGNELTCIVANRDEDTDNGICVECGSETRMGCTCQLNDDCFAPSDPFGPLDCYGGSEAGWPAGTGFCWPTSVPEHQCAFNCLALQDRFCAEEGDCQYVCNHDVGACLTTSTDIPSAITCWEDNHQIPDGNGNCEAQCLDDCECTSAFGYPFNVFACVGGQCTPCFDQSCENACE